MRSPAGQSSGGRDGLVRLAGDPSRPAVRKCHRKRQRAFEELEMRIFQKKKKKCYNVTRTPFPLISFLVCKNGESFTSLIY